VRQSHSLSRGRSVLPRVRSFGAVAAVTTGLVLSAPVSAFAAKPPVSPVTPTVACYWGNADGSTTFSVGYINSGTTTVSYPVGTLNFVNPAPADRGQPTDFAPGTHTNVWAPTVTAADLGNNPNWTVNGVAVNYSGNIPACTSKPVSVSGSTTGYLGATAAIVGIGAYIISKPRRRRGLRTSAKSTAPASA
jgi:hypothetical protein